MPKEFKQISKHSGFMKHNGGLLFKKVGQKKFKFITKVKKNHLNRAGITHGGYIASIIDAGAGTSVHSITKNKISVTIALDIKFIGSSKLGDEIVGEVLILKQTKSLIFVSCNLICKKKIIASASGIWKKTDKFFK
jgi:acyl-coenzyme A thioesterase PaaI-like protein|tara:strand:+ start:471 stop:878 length:408 start_codon:yes stop_codon:yes gene_type:complete